MKWHETLLWEHVVVNLENTDRPGKSGVIDDIQQILQSRYTQFDKDQTNITNDRVNKQLSKCNVVDNLETIISKYEPLTTGTILLTQFYQSPSDERNDEIVKSIHNNINNEHIQEVHLFTEPDNLEKCKEHFTHEKVKIVNIPNRLTYRSIFEYVYETQSDDKGYLLCNTDCNFDETVCVLPYLIDGIFYTMTRWDVTPDGNINGLDPCAESWSENSFGTVLPDFSPDRKLEPWSNDAWYFRRNMLDMISHKIDRYGITLGTNLCEIQLQYNLHQQGVQMRNIGFAGHVKCLHNHSTNFREFKNWQNVPSETIPGIFPCDVHHRTNFNSIENCYRLRGDCNWLDKNIYEHEYSEYVVTDILQYIHTKEKEQQDRQPHTNHTYTTNLAVVLQCTATEIESHLVYECLNNYITKVETNHSFDLLIYIDNKVDSSHYKTLIGYQEYDCVNKVIVTSHDIPPERNIYIKPWLEDNLVMPEQIPELGLSNGPNELFYKTLQNIKNRQYENFVLIEPDTLPTSTDWFDYIHDYVINSTGEWVITGSSYKGSDPANIASWYSDYLNGVAVYKNNIKLHDLMSRSENFIKHIVTEHQFRMFMNYDVAHDHYIRTYEPWNHALLVDCDFIVNMSPIYDKNQSIEDILHQYPNCKILHNKREIEDSPD